MNNNNKMKKIVVIFVLCLTAVLADDELELCRTDVSAKENFSPAFYTGIWYELFYSDHAFEAECTTHHYTRRGLQQVFDVESTFVFADMYIRREGVASIAFPDETPMRAIFNGTMEIEGELAYYIYQVYATDYTNYSILWACHVENDQPIENVAIFSRSTTISDAVLSKVDALVAEIGFNRADFRPVSHDEEVCILPAK